MAGPFPSERDIPTKDLLPLTFDKFMKIQRSPKFDACKHRICWTDVIMLTDSSIFKNYDKN
jgi:hypothetical protein